jgi:DNA adenine methylase
MVETHTPGLFQIKLRLLVTLQTTTQEGGHFLLSVCLLCDLTAGYYTELRNVQERQKEPDVKITALTPWAGGKRTMAALIVQQLGAHKAYVEPFCGSMAVLLAKPPCSFEIVNDLHGDLMNLAWTVADPSEGPRLYRRLRRLPDAEEIFHKAIGLLPGLPLADGPDGVSRATGSRAYWYFVLSWMGRSGLVGAVNKPSFAIRYNAAGGNQAVRFASAVASIPAWRRRLRTVTLLRRNGLELLERLRDDAGQALYIDPPYLDKKIRYEYDFSAHDHKRLAQALARFKRSRVVVSYYDHPDLTALYPGWTRLDCTRAKHLSVQGRPDDDGGRTSTTAPEVLLVNHQPILAQERTEHAT